MVLAPEHPLVAQLTTADKRTEVDAYLEETRHRSDIERLSTVGGKERCLHWRVLR